MVTAVELPTGNPPALTPARRGFWRNLRRVLRRKPTRIAGAVIVAVFVVVGVVGPFLYPANLPTDPGNAYAGPGWPHLLGTDFQGTDVLALLVTGCRYVLVASVIAAACTVIVGTGIGLYAGYRRGGPDSVLMRITDFVITIPGLPLLLVLSTLWKYSNPLTMGLVLGVTGWGSLARAVRSQTLSLRERGFIEAARGLGLSTAHVVRRELLPNVAPYVAMNLLISVTVYIYLEVGLFFLGVLPFNENNWGVMINQAVQNGVTQTGQGLAYLLSPLIAILLLTLGVVLLVDAMDEVFNPRLRED
jgi:peptide/nickel transport system permease protein